MIQDDAILMSAEHGPLAHGAEWFHGPPVFIPTGDLSCPSSVTGSNTASGSALPAWDGCAGNRRHPVPGSSGTPAARAGISDDSGDFTAAWRETGQFLWANHKDSVTHQLPCPK